MDTLIIRYKKKGAAGDLIQACIHWLEYKGILDLLIERSRHYDSLDGLIKFMKTFSNGHDLINLSMHWASTPEGQEYWHDICDEYDEFWSKTYNILKLKKNN